MIGYLRGSVSHLLEEYCYLDVQGVGYRVFIPTSTRHKLAVGTTVSLFTYLNVREDALLLYGFHTEGEYDLFIKLTSVTGIGPKVALGILSAINPDQFRLAISKKNIAALTAIPGVGKKTAERIILELKDKIGVVAGNDFDEEPFSVSAGIADDIRQQALQALTSLGYSNAEITPILRKIGNEGQSVEELVKLALKEFSRR